MHKNQRVQKGLSVLKENCMPLPKVSANTQNKGGSIDEVLTNGGRMVN